MTSRSLLALLVAACTTLAGCTQGPGVDSGTSDGDVANGGNDQPGDGGDELDAEDPPLPDDGDGGDGPDAGDPPPPDDGDGDAEPPVRECREFALDVEPRSFRPGEFLRFGIALENCTDETLHVTLPYCAKTGEVDVVIEVDGEPWYVSRGPLLPEPVEAACDTFERTIEPGQAFVIPLHWDGRLKTTDCRAMRCADDAWAPHQAYRVKAEVTSAEGDSWTAAGDVEFLPPELPPYANDGEITFLLEDAYAEGDTVQVKVRNDGERTFRYRTYYAACDLEYYDGDGYPFIVPPGTHCDVGNDASLAPGETVTLFQWTLEECVEDRWGCAESRPLPPGTYHVAGTFHEDVDRSWEKEDAATRAGTTFRIT